MFVLSIATFTFTFVLAAMLEGTLLPFNMAAKTT